VSQQGPGQPDGGVARVYGLERHRRRSRGPARTAHVGMAVFLGSWAMLFVGLFFAYAFVRARAPAWPPLDAPPLPRLLPGLNTLAILASSAAVARAVGQRELGRARAAAGLLAGAAALGSAFLASQLLVWGELWRGGLLPSSGPYGSVFYAFTAFHALHVLVGLAGLGAVAVRLRSRAGATPTDVRLWGWYWHFVGVLWVLLYATLYLA
jgi:heme/copper-type cytochrome/quinol oxidase subunit 3